MKFNLFEKFAELTLFEWLMLAGMAAIIALIIFYNRPLTKKTSPSVSALAKGALCVSLAFVLSYIKLFSMPLGGSITLFSILPIAVFAYLYGPKYGFLAGFAYSVLQVIQGAQIVHWAQFILDYFLAFTLYGVAGFFKKSLPLAVLFAGLARFFCSVVSGVVFFSSYAAEAGYSSALLYSLAYNGMTIGIDTAICVAAALLPPVKRTIERLRA